MRGCVAGLILSAAALPIASGENIAFHRVCCKQDRAIPPPLLPPPSEDLIQDWAAAVSQLKRGKCVHSFGFGRTDDLQVQGEWPYRFEKQNRGFHGAYKTHAAELMSTDEHVPCFSIQMMFEGPLPEERGVDFFVPQHLDEIVRGKPKVVIETGTATVDGALNVLHFKTCEKRTFKKNAFRSERKYVTDPTRFSKVVTREVLRESVDGLGIGESACGLFFEFATGGSRVVSRQQLQGCMFEDQIGDLLTVDKILSIDVPSLLLDIHDKMKSPEGDAWLTKVPVCLLKSSHIEKKTTISKSKASRSQSNSSASRSRSRCVSKHEDEENKHAPASGEVGRVESRTVDLSIWKDQHVTIFRKIYNSQQFLKIKDFTMWKTFKSTDMQQKIGAAEATPHDDVDDVLVTPQRVARFLLVDSTLGASGAKYNQVVNEAIIRRLQDDKLPIFSVCATELRMRALQTKRHRFTDDFRFAASKGPIRTSYAYGSLKDVKMGDLIEGDCIALGLFGVPETHYRGYRVTNELKSFLTIQYRAKNGDVDANGLRLLNIGQVNAYFNPPKRLLWDVFGGIVGGTGTIFSRAAEFIESEGMWPPEVEDEVATAALQKKKLPDSVTIEIKRKGGGREVFQVPTSSRVRKSSAGLLSKVMEIDFYPYG